MSRFCGIDGCRDGWVVVVQDSSEASLSARVLTTAQLGALDYDLAGIDVPIGLVDRGARTADQLAREYLGSPRSSSVFPTPIRPALHAASWEEACEITAAADGRRMTRQTFAFLPKIREIDTLLQARPELPHRLFEVHPEISFAAWSGAPIAHRKKSPAGQEARQALIAAVYGADTFSRLAAEVAGRGCGEDDLADALAVLWTARRIRDGDARRLPRTPIYDSTGLPMHMWY